MSIRLFFSLIVYLLFLVTNLIAADHNCLTSDHQKLLYSKLNIDSLNLYIKKFHPLECTGKIPNDFITHYDGTKLNLDGSESTSTLKEIEKSSVVQNSILFSNGSVLYNDYLSAFVSKVLDSLLMDSIELRSIFRVYILKSTKSNAMITNDGQIYVTVGLLAKINNEDELAYILSHEVSHYLLKHNYDTFEQKQNLDKEKNKFRAKEEKLDYLLNKFYSRSRNQELEADKLGYQLFLSSKYNPNSILNIFDVLANSYLPFSNKQFKANHLFGSGTLNQSLHLSDTSVVIPDSVLYGFYSHSTHPDLATRKDSLLSYKRTNDSSKLASSGPSIVFELVQTLARFELSHLEYTDENYYTSLFYASQLIEKFSNNAYLSKLVDKSLFAHYTSIGKLRADTTKSIVFGRTIQVKNVLDSVKKQNLEVLLFLKYAHALKRSDFTDPDYQYLVSHFLNSYALKRRVKVFKSIHSYLKNEISSDSVIIFFESSLRDDHKSIRLEGLKDKLSEIFDDRYKKSYANLLFQKKSKVSTPKVLVIPKIIFYDSNKKKLRDPSPIVKKFYENLMWKSTKNGIDYSLLTSYMLSSEKSSYYNMYSYLHRLFTYESNKLDLGKNLDQKMLQNIKKEFGVSHVYFSVLYIEKKGNKRKDYFQTYVYNFDDTNPEHWGTGDCSSLYTDLRFSCFESTVLPWEKSYLQE